MADKKHHGALRGLQAYCIDRTLPGPEALASADSLGRDAPAGPQRQNLWILANAIRWLLAVGAAAKVYRDRLLAFYIDPELWSSFESGGYPEYQFWGALAVWRRAEELGDRELATAAHTYLRRRLALAALCAAPTGQLVMPMGRCYASDSVGRLTPKGESPVGMQAILCGLLGRGEHWPPDGVGPGYWRSDGHWLAALGLRQGKPPGPAPLVEGLFAPSELSELTGLMREPSPGVLSLLAGIRLPGGSSLVVQIARNGFIAAMTGIVSPGYNRAQPLAYYINGEARFLVTRPPAGAHEVASSVWLATGREGALGEYRLPPLEGPVVTLVFDSGGGRVVGAEVSAPSPPRGPERPSEPTRPSNPPPPSPPVDEPQPQPQPTGGLQAAARELDSAWTAFTGGGGRPARERMEKAVERVKELAAGL